MWLDAEKKNMLKKYVEKCCEIKIWNEGKKSAIIIKDEN